MPRRRQTEQAPQAAPGQAYGEASEQIQAQNIIPLPNRRVLPAESHQAGASAGNAPAVPPVDPWAEAIAAAQATPPPDSPGLAAPTRRPGAADAPVRNQPRPVSRARASSIADSFAMLADLTGNPAYRALAAQAAQQGL